MKQLNLTVIFFFLVLNIGFAQSDWIEAGDKERLKERFFSQASWIWRDTIITKNQKVFFRKEFEVNSNKKILKAQLRASVDDVFAIWINGNICGGGTQWVMPIEADVLKFLIAGNNTISASCANATAPEAGLIAELVLSYSDGSKQIIPTDLTWKNSSVESPEYRYNRFDDSGWDKVTVRYKYGDGIYKNAFDKYERPRSVMVRRKMKLQDVKEAVVTVTGLGMYEFYVNGKKQGNNVLAPEWTDFDRRVNARVYNVTDQLIKGENVFSAILGNGWWSSGISLDQSWDMKKAMYSAGPLKLFFKMELTYKNGKKEFITADEKWKWYPSPIMDNSIYHGEIYDARLEQKDWKLPTFNDASWSTCKKISTSKPEIVIQNYEPIVVGSRIEPQKILKLKDGNFIVDFGINYTGWVEIKGKGNRGDTLKLIFSEILDSTGNLKRESYRTARASDFYIFKGGTELETWEPRFTYRGFRYVLVKGISNLANDDIVGKWVHTNLKPTGNFSSSDSLINKIHGLSTRTGLNNFTSVATDCPQRDERLGWLADAQLFSGTALYNWDMKNFYRKALRDIGDGFDASGYVADVAPAKPFMSSNNPGWEDALLIFAWKSYLFYGDRSILEEFYTHFKRFLDFRKAHIEEGLLKYERGSWGEWLAPELSSNELFNNVYNIYSFILGAKIAKVLGDETKVAEYKTLETSLKKSFHKKFYKENLRTYDLGVQSSLIMPLYLGLVPNEIFKEVLDTLLADIKDHNYHLSTGLHSTAYILKVLSENGYPEIAYKILKQKTYPSWGYMIDNGATTWWERWNSNTINTKQETMNSYNHPVLGSVDEWLYSGLAGIKPIEEKPGFEEFSIMPYIDEVDSFNVSYESVKGNISVALATSKDQKTIKLNVPPKSTAWFIFNTKRYNVNNPNLERIEIREYILKGLPRDKYKAIRLNQGSHTIHLIVK